MVNIGICDDDKYTVAELERLIYDIATEKRLKVEVEAYYDGSSIENDIVKGVKFDLFFLDIEMKQNGITTAKRIRELKNDFLIIYISNYEKYFRELFEVGAFRFLDKPIDKIKFTQYFLEAIDTVNKEDSYLLYKYNRQINKVKLKNVIYFESNRRKVLIHKIDGTVLEYYGKLNDLESYLKKSEIKFMRTHQSFLVNCEYIIGWKYTNLILEGQIYIPISEDQQKRIQIQYGEYIRKDILKII